MIIVYTTGYIKGLGLNPGSGNSYWFFLAWHSQYRRPWSGKLLILDPRTPKTRRTRSKGLKFERNREPSFFLHCTMITLAYLVPFDHGGLSHWASLSPVGSGTTRKRADAGPLGNGGPTTLNATENFIVKKLRYFSVKE